MAGAILLSVPATSRAQASSPSMETADDRALFDGAGYRTARYRTPIAVDPRPAPRLALVAARDLQPGRDALFIDVMPVEGGTRDTQTGIWQLSEDHLTIAGAQWHPETGRSPVDGTLWAGLITSIADARRQSPGMPVVVFCRADCWMSWNAAKRLADQGVGNVWWLAEGTDGWNDRGGRLVAGVPRAIKNRELMGKGE